MSRDEDIDRFVDEHRDALREESDRMIAQNERDLYDAARRGDIEKVDDITREPEHDCEDCWIEGPGGVGRECGICGAKL